MRISKIALITFVCAVGAAAQDKVTVPISNPSQPVTLKVSTMNGSIKVTAGTGKDVIVSTEDGGARLRERNPRDGAPPGMTRIGGGRSGVDIEEDHNVVTVNSGPAGGNGNLVIETPANTNLKLRTTNGSTIDVTGISGDHEIENTNGGIHLNNVSGSVVAHTLNGAVIVSLDRITGTKPMSFTSMNGKVDVTMPADTKARLRLKSDNGAIYSDFDVKLEPDASKPVVEDNRGANGKYKISIDKAVTGTINGGGPEYTFQTMNGNILIHKK
ncbi:MAG TPA: DUF4097 family beta strand repeat-containing protein [Bryobacteraceae bacterium]|nr:DUF4097 family beta strand repeat-containing protein [Bryobacteraceae bacterium]